jgi:adenylate cyclase
MTANNFKRKLTAILSADVEGYSRLMGENEESTVRTLTAYRELMSGLIQRYRGRVVDSPGDNLLAEFGSVMDAVRCAVEIQEELRIRNAELPEGRKMRFRIGINLGDVIEEGGRIYGDGINVAARVEGLAEGGGICISGTVYDSIRNKLSWNYDFLGEHTVKNIKEPVRVYRIRMESEAAAAIVKEKKARLMTWQRAALAVVVILIFGAVAIWYFSFRQTPVVSDVKEAPVVSDVKEGPKTIAVLPFVNLSSDPEQMYFADGLSEELLNYLSKIADLRVTSRTSSFTFKESDKTVQEIASILGVDHILEGSVRKAGNTLRISAQLIRAVDEFHIWSKTYDRELKDIFAVQEDIAKAVADELKVTLGIDKSVKRLGGTDNVEAYELYLVARGYGNLQSRQALESINASIALDPDFADAWVAKCTFHLMNAMVTSADRVSLEQDAALNAALRAIELEPSYGMAYYSLGDVYSARSKFIEAELAYQKGMELTNELMVAFRQGPPALLIMRYCCPGYLKKCHEYIEEDRRNDPLNPTIRALYMLYLGFLGDMERAEKEYEHGKVIFGDQWLVTGDYYITILRFGAKEDLSINEIPEYPQPSWAIGREHLESPEEGLMELHRFYSSQDYLDPVSLIMISIWATYFGDAELASNAMERSVSLHTLGLVYFWAPLFHEVRQLPRFKEFVRKIGLVDYWNKFGWPDTCRPVGDGDFECD